MENGNLPKTEQELQDLIAAKVKEETEKLVSKHNGEMATMRQRHDAELKKAKEEANLSAEELAKRKVEEQNEIQQKELSELRAYKKSSELSQKLEKAGLPTYFKNDTRLLNANDNDVDGVIKEVKKEYEATLPKGATYSTVVQTGNGSQKGNQETDKTQLFENVGSTIKEALGR